MTKTAYATAALNRLNLASSVMGVSVPVPGLTVVGVIVADASGTYRYDETATGYTEEFLEPPPPAPDAAEPPLADAGANG